MNTRDLVLTLTVGIIAAACASAPPREPHSKYDQGRPPSFLRGAPELIDGEEASRVCGALKDTGAKRDCEVVLTKREFERKAIDLCLDGAAAAAVDCLRLIAGQFYGEPSLELCGTMDHGDARNRCLDVVGSRTLSVGQVAYCADSPDPNDCLEDAVDYTLDPHELHHLAVRAARWLVENPLEEDPELEAKLARFASLTDEEQREVARAEEARNRARGARIQEMYAKLQDWIIEIYPERNIAKERSRFLFNFAGGANAQLHILYCSEKEYLIFFAPTTAVNAYSGRYEMDVYDTVISGLMRTFHENDLEPRLFYPGMRGYLSSDETKIYDTEGPTFFLEYARGDIAGAFDFGIEAPASFITRDERNADEQVEACKKIALKEVFAAGDRADEREASKKRIRREIDAALGR